MNRTNMFHILSFFRVFTEIRRNEDFERFKVASGTNHKEYANKNM